MDETLEETAFKLGEQMKKGFISHLILIVLNDAPSHGYKIIQEIEHRSMGMWNPNTSTIYHILESLEDKGLINCIKEESKGRQKKVYAISEKGENALDLLIEKYKEMQESMKKMIFSSLALTDELDDLEHDIIGYFIPNDLSPMEKTSGKSSKEQFKFLLSMKTMMEQRIIKLKDCISQLEKDIKKLENKIKNEK